jgi:putative endonuclease
LLIFFLSFPRKRESTCRRKLNVKQWIPAFAGMTMSLVLKEHNYSVYIMASHRHGTLYVGVTTDLPGRVWQHKTGSVKGFTSRYKVNILVWFEMHTDITEAIRREKQIKKWLRAWKIELIEGDNPSWRDLTGDVYGPE